MSASPGKRRLWIIGLAVLAVVLAFAVALPFVLDVERHRERIEQALRDATGWEAELGEIRLSVLGGLALTVRPARLAAPEGGSQFEVGGLAVRARIAPLFRGRLEVERIELDAPEITLARLDAERGWILPLPAVEEGAPASGSEGAAGSSPAVSIDRIDVRNGALRIEDRTVDPPLTLVVEGVEIEFEPATGVLRGEGSFGGDGGRIGWSGSGDGSLTLTLDSVRSELLAPWVGDGVLHPGGTFAGEIQADLPDRIGGTLTADSLRILAGNVALPTTELKFRLKSEAGAWLAEEIELRTGGARLVGRGTLVPLSLSFELPPTPLETALALSNAAFPLGLDVTPPGSASLRARVDQPEGGELTYEAEGELSAARFVAAEILPPVNDLQTTFRLGRSGALKLKILEATLGGGSLVGAIQLDSIDPLGTLGFDGKVSGASLGALISGLVSDSAEQVSGPTEIHGKLSVDLGDAVVEAGSIGGSLELSAGEVSLAGWDLEGAFREALTKRLGKLAELAARIDPAAAKRFEADDSGNSARRLLDRLDTRVSFDSLPWRLQTVAIESGGVSASGEGSFDPIGGTVDLDLRVELDRATSERYVARYPQLAPLVNEGGGIRLPMRLEGPLTKPRVELQLSKLVPGTTDSPEKVGKGLLDRFLKKKRDDH